MPVAVCRWSGRSALAGVDLGDQPAVVALGQSHGGDVDGGEGSVVAGSGQAYSMKAVRPLSPSMARIQAQPVAASTVLSRMSKTATPNRSSASGCLAVGLQELSDGLGLRRQWRR